MIKDRNTLHPTIESRCFPFLGFFPAAFDTYGMLEPAYHQMDVLQETGYWVYYDYYTKNWKYKKLF